MSAKQNGVSPRLLRVAVCLLCCWQCNRPPFMFLRFPLVLREGSAAWSCHPTQHQLGGAAQALELHTICDVPDLSKYGVGKATNGGGLMYAMRPSAVGTANEVGPQG